MNYKRRFDKNRCMLQKGESQRPDGLYVFRWTDIFGKRHSIYAKDLDELRKKEQILELNKLEGIKEAPVSLTVESLYETWIQLKRGIRASTESGYVQVFDSMIRPSFGRKRVVNLKKSDIRAFYISLLENRGVSISSVERVRQ